MFQFPTFAHLTVWLAFNQPGFPIRISRDQRLFAPPPSFSQLITSFIASESQGIHRLPFFYFFILTSHIVHINAYNAVGMFIFSSFYVFFSLIRFKFHSYLFDLHTYIKQHTKSFLCFVHHVKELFLRFFDPDPILVVQESSLFNKRILGELRNLWRITDSNRWPPACKAGALASWANPPSFEWIMNS